MAVPISATRLAGLAHFCPKPSGPFNSSGLGEGLWLSLGSVGGAEILGPNGCRTGSGHIIIKAEFP